MREAIEGGAGQSFAAQDLDPRLKGQVGGDDETGAFVGGADHVKDEFGAQFAGRHIAEFVENQKIEFG